VEWIGVELVIGRAKEDELIGDVYGLFVEFDN
jgi:hypothetical protein